jgi:branched-subunit amino acid ABC-type transport system permease component
VVAVAFAVRGLLAATLSRQSYVFPDLIPFTRLQNGGVLSLGGGVTLPVRAFFVIGAGLGLAALAAGFLDRTRHGRAMQAVAEDATAARTIGLPIEWLRAAAFALAGGLAALAAVLQAPSVPVFADTGALIGLKGLVAALLARFGSPWKAFAAGLAVGVLETGASSLHIGVLRLGPAYGDVVPLAFALVLVAARYRRDQVEVVE